MAGIKGFFLSLEAIMAVVLIAGLLGIIVFPQQAIEKDTAAFQSATGNARDASIIGTYQKRQAQSYSLQENIDLTAEQAGCRQAIITTEETSPFNNRADYQEYTYCDKK